MQKQQHHEGLNLSMPVLFGTAGVILWLFFAGTYLLMVVMDTLRG